MKKKILAIVAIACCIGANAQEQVETENGPKSDFIYNNGNIGIGTSTPATALDVIGSIRGTGTVTVNKNGSYMVAINGQNYGYVKGRDASFQDKFLITTNGNSYLNGGKLGIGTTTPATELDVIGSIRGTGTITVNKNGAYLVALNGQDYGYIKGRDASFSDKFFISSNGTSYLNGGNVGIGTQSPSSPLHLMSNTDGIVTLQTNDDNYLFMNWKDNSGTRRAWTGLDSNLREFRINVENGTDEIIFNGGNVGIGTSNPGSFKLAVNGHIRAKEITVDTGWSDFVFYKDYDLPTLSEVEAHIKDKGHLQDIPSADEVAKNGIKLGEMDAKLLQKIEELMLYTIQQQKEIDNLKSQNISLMKDIRNLINK